MAGTRAGTGTGAENPISDRVAANPGALARDGSELDNDEQVDDDDEYLDRGGVVVSR